MSLPLDKIVLMIMITSTGGAKKVRCMIDRTERGMNHQKGRGKTREKGRIREISLLMIIRRVEVLFLMTDQKKT